MIVSKRGAFQSYIIYVYSCASIDTVSVSVEKIRRMARERQRVVGVIVPVKVRDL